MKPWLTGPRLGALGLLGAALGLLGAWESLGERRTRGLEARVQQSLRNRDFLVSSEEVLALLRDRRVPVELFDLRDEAAYNRFHLTDACRIEAGDTSPIQAAPAIVVKIVISDDETRATSVYRQLALQGVPAVYVLEGGAEGWLGAFGARSCRRVPADCNPRLALGARHPASNPDPELVPTGKFSPKVKLAVAGKKPTGGCGG